MRPLRTLYRLSDEADEAAMRALGDAPSHFGWPTVVAERDGEILGYLATNERDDQIFVGPLVVKGGRNRAVIALRLIEAYEGLLKKIGITQYRFAVRDDNEWSGTCQHMDWFDHEGLFGEQHVFKRTLQ